MVVHLRGPGARGGRPGHRQTRPHRPQGTEAGAGAVSAVLDRVFPADQCDWEYVAQVAAAADRRPIDDEGEVA